MSRWFAPLLMFVSLHLVACAQETEVTKFRAMTYNIQWLSEDANPARINNLREIVGTLHPNILAVQEVQSKRALQQFLGAEWSIAIQDDPHDWQELGVCVKAPLKIKKSGLVFPGKELDVQFPGIRDMMRAEVEFPNGRVIAVYSVHLKSRRGGRWITDVQRESAARLIAAYFKSHPNEDRIFMGDLNDSPDDRCANIIETGVMDAAAGTVNVPNPLMINLLEPLYRKDYVTLDLDRKFLGDPISPIVPGAYAENEKWRGKEHKFPDDLQVIQTCFDQIMVSSGIFAKWKKTDVFSESVALRGSNGRVKVTEQPYSVEYTEKGTKASDHLPVYADFDLE